MNLTYLYNLYKSKNLVIENPRSLQISRHDLRADSAGGVTRISYPSVYEVDVQFTEPIGYDRERIETITVKTDELCTTFYDVKVTGSGHNSVSFAARRVTKEQEGIL